jgi:serine/threonine-protein kinase
MLVISVALVRATKAEADATQARQRAEALNAFLLNEILAAPSPEEQGRDVRLVDALQRASSRLDERFGADPIAKSDVARTIGVSFMALGLYDEADALLTEALEAAQTSNAPTHDEAIASMNQLAKLRWLQREPEASKALFQQAFDAATTTLGDAHERTLEAMTGLAVMRRVTGDLDGARDMCEAALRIRMERDGPTHKETLALTNNLAVIEREAGRPERAIELLQSARDRALESLGPMHPSTALLEINLASAMLAHGDRAQACDVLRDALDRQIKTLGEAHPEVALTKLALAEALITIDNDESLRILDDVAAHPERIGAAGMDRISSLRRRIHKSESAP